jgi:hypothetical protein
MLSLDDKKEKVINGIDPLICILVKNIPGSEASSS